MPNSLRRVINYLNRDSSSTSAENSEEKISRMKSEIECLFEDLKKDIEEYKKKNPQ